MHHCRLSCTTAMLLGWGNCWCRRNFLLGIARLGQAVCECGLLHVIQPLLKLSKKTIKMNINNTHNIDQMY